MSSSTMDAIRSRIQEVTVEQMVEESMRALPHWLTDLPSRISHGIRTPMTSIAGFEEVLGESQELPEELRSEFRGIIEDERERLVRFLTSIRMFELIRKHELTLDMTYDDAAETVRKACHGFRRTAHVRKVQLSVLIPSEPKMFMADHRQLQFAVELLVGNALSVTSPGGTVKVIAKMLPVGLSVSVEDTGCGIDRKDLPYVFVPFTRVAHPDDSGSELGLGLTVTRHIVKLHGGQIDAASIPSKGSRFRLLIPH